MDAVVIPATPKPGSLRAVLMAARLPTLMVGASPLLYAAAFARAGEDLPPQAWVVWGVALAATLLMQAGANLVNDVKDAEKGVDTHRRLGPTRVTQGGILTAGQVRSCYRVAFAGALVLGAGLALYAGPVFFLLAVLCSLVAYLYTGGPLPLAYIALGEAMAFLFFGPVAVAGTHFLMTRHYDPGMLAWGAGPGFLAAAVMGINNARDRETDLAAGKRTLATLFGARAGTAVPMLALAGAQAVMLAALVQGPVTWPAGLAFAATSLLALVIAGTKLRGATPRYNVALKMTALLCFLYGLAFHLVLAPMGTH